MASSLLDLEKKLKSFFNQGAQTVGKFANNQIQQLPPVRAFNNIQTLVNTPKFQQTTKSVLNSTPAQYIGKQPLLRTPGVNVIPQMPTLEKVSPTIGQYAQGQFGNQLKTLFNPKAPISDRGIAGLQAGFSATPAGMAYNVLGGGIAGALNSIRTGQDVRKSVQKSIANPADIAGTGLGVQNPILALGINVTTGNPKAALKSVKNVKGIVSSLKGVNPQAFDLHPQDAEELAVIGEKLLKKVPLNFQENATLERSFARLFPKIDLNKASNKKVQQVIAATLDRYNAIPKNVRTPFPSMGIASSEENISKSANYSRQLPHLPQQTQTGELQQLQKLSKANSSSTNQITSINSIPNNVNPLPWEKAPQYDKNSANFELGKAVSNADENMDGFKKLFKKWVGEREMASTTATQKAAQFKNIPSDKGSEIIKVRENPNLKTTKEVRGVAQKLGKEFDSLYNEAKKEGVEMGYLENYITHIWKEPFEDVAQSYRIFKQRSGFQNERSLPTYEEGIQMGLQPKFTNPAQIVDSYVRNLEQLKANLRFFKDMRKQGYIVDASVGRRTPGFVPLDGPGFPRSTSTFEGQTIVGNYYAPQQVAEQINKLFSPENTGLLGRAAQIGAKISGTAQDVVLSGGLPKTPLNAFTLAQVQKEFLTGRVSSPIGSFVRSLRKGSSLEFFQKNSEQIKKMQARNVPIRSEYEIANLIDKDTTTRTLGEKAGKLWNSVVNEPTFKRFMPQLQINLFNDIEKQALKSGKSTNEAADIAAKAVMKFYGLTDTATQATRSKLGSDIATTTLFAPKFRESMINFWINNLKVLRNPTALENRANLKFIAGAILTLGAMDGLNRVLNDGSGMLDNGPGKEDKLLIPIGKITGNSNDKTVIGIPYLSSIATVPRALFREILALGRGDAQAALKDAFQSYASVAVKPLGDVATNQDYFGKEITSETDTTQEKLSKQGKYLLSQYTGHPYLRELTDQRNQSDPLYQRLSRGAEMPLRFYDTDSLAKGKFYDEYYKLKPFNEQLQTLTYRDPQKAAEFYNANADKIERYNKLKGLQDAYYSAGQDINLLKVGERKDGQVNAKSGPAKMTIKGNEYEGTVVGDRFVYTDPETNSIATSSLKTIEKENRSYEKGVIDAEYSLFTDRLKRAGDTVGWQQATQQYVDYLKEYKKTLTDKKEQITIQNKIEDLENSLAKSGSGKRAKKISIKRTSVPRLSFKGSNIGSGKKVPVIKITKGPVKAAASPIRTIKVVTPARKISYKIQGPTKIQGLTQGVKLV